MKRPIFLIIATVLILILAAVWVYVLLYGNPENLSEQFTDFNFNNETVVETPPEPTPEPEPTVAVDDARLQQLTTTPVVGYQIIQPTPTSTALVYYVEAGTGHIFSINLDTGEEERISRTTIPNTSDATISPNGEFVVITSGSGGRKETLVGRRSTTSDTLLTTPLNELVDSVHPTTNNTFLYSTPDGNTMVVKEYNPTTNTTETLFTIPFREATLVWGDTADSVHYFYPKPSRYLEGALYKFADGAISRTPVSGFGMSAISDKNSVLYSESIQNSYKTTIFNVENNTSIESVLSIIPEQCAVLKQNLSTLICSSSFGNTPTSLPDSWYTGKISAGKQLFLINLKTGGFKGRVVFSDTGRELNISDIEINNYNSLVLIKNKLDNTLWLYKLKF